MGLRKWYGRVSMSNSPVNSTRIAFLLLGASLALGFIIASEKLSKAIAQVTHHRPEISVKGVATQDVKSDLAILNCQLSWRGTDPVEGRKNFIKQREELLKKVHDLGITDEEITVEPIGQYRLEPASVKATVAIEYDKYARGTVTDHVLYQSYKVTSKQIDLIDKISRLELQFENDVQISRDNVIYKLVNVDDSKKELLEAAAKNARARADVLINGSGSKIGGLLDASQGVFQIQAKNSVGDGDYGSVDTSSIQKTIRVVVSMTYEIVKE